MIGNPLIAEQMLKHALEVGLYVPVRIYEDEWGATRIDYDEVAPIIEWLSNERVNEVVRGLDQEFEELAKGAAG